MAAVWKTPSRLKHLYALEDWLTMLNPRRALFVLPLLVALMIVAVELTLAFNSITGVYTIKSTGQLIPFIVGLGGFWTTVNDLMTDYYKVLYSSSHSLTDIEF